MAIEDEWRADFARLGPDVMRARLQGRLVGSAQIDTLLTWLAEQDAAERARISASHLEQYRTARTAKNAAIIAAIAAIVSMTPVIISGVRFMLHLYR